MSGRSAWAAGLLASMAFCLVIIDGSLANPTPTTPPSILCFGDSLTRGGVFIRRALQEGTAAAQAFKPKQQAFAGGPHKPSAMGDGNNAHPLAGWRFAQPGVAKPAGSKMQPNGAGWGLGQMMGKPKGLGPGAMNELKFRNVAARMGNRQATAQGAPRGMMLFTLHPYSIELTRLLKGEFNGSEVNVDTSGASGERACGDGETSPMADRLRMLLAKRLEPQHTDTPWTHAVILAGTNDLGTDKSANDIFHCISSLHVMCHEAGMRTVVVTVPQSAYLTQHPDIRAKQEAINRQLAQFVEEHREKSTLADLAAAIPFTMSPDDAEGVAMWQRDGLHFTAVGYDRVGRVVFDAFKKAWLS